MVSGLAFWIFLIVAFLIIIPVHEAAHAWSAYVLGDDTAKNEGRMSLNPIRHLDLVGTLFLIFARFGWGKPVPVNTSKFKNPRMGYVITSFAGPASNLALAAVIVLIQKYIIGDVTNIYLVGLQQFLGITVELSIFLMLFNLIPIFPLDGAKIWYLLIPEEKQEFITDMERNGPKILLSLLLLDWLIPQISLIGWLAIPTQFIMGILYYTT